MILSPLERNLLQNGTRSPRPAHNMREMGCENRQTARREAKKGALACRGAPVSNPVPATMVVSLCDLAVPHPSLRDGWGTRAQDVCAPWSRAGSELPVGRHQWHAQVRPSIGIRMAYALSVTREAASNCRNGAPAMKRGTKARRHEGTKGGREEGTKARRREGTEGGMRGAWVLRHGGDGERAGVPRRSRSEGWGTENNHNGAAVRRASVGGSLVPVLS